MFMCYVPTTVIDGLKIWFGLSRIYSLLKLIPCVHHISLVRYIFPGRL